MTEIVQKKETSAQRAERLKREKNPWAAFDEVRDLCPRRPFQRRSRMGLVLLQMVGHLHAGRWRGSHGWKGRRRPRLRLLHDAHRLSPTAYFLPTSFAPLADLTRKYARNLADITVRQAIQLHWLTIESLPEVVDALDSIGLSPKGACGDVVRNVTGCPLAGVAADELIDSSALAIEIAKMLTGNPEFFNLPRKFKISVTGCPSWCNYPEINDIGLSAVKHDGVGRLLRARRRWPLR